MIAMNHWTTICWDVNPNTGKLAPYVRLTPDFVDLEKLSYSWGLSVGGFQDNEEDAKKFAKSVAIFMDGVFAQAIAEATNASYIDEAMESNISDEYDDLFVMFD